MKINKIIIHCSATKTGRETTAEEIHAWHKARGWDGIGYHYVIKIDGTIENGRPDYWMGSHARGHNQGSLGICMIGLDEFTTEQWTSLSELISALTNKHHGINEIIGHNEISKKTCPGFDVQQWLGGRNGKT